jgi:DNA-binding transcriptional ArsR family regulator
MTASALASLAGLLADRTRAAFLLALLDGRAWTAGELARHAGVAPSTATGHLTRLVDAGLLAQERQGRHRYVRLAGPATAQLLEDLAGHPLATGVPAPAGSLRVATANAALARGRTCYDHLAGRLGVAVTGAMTATGLLRQDAGFALTDAGLAWLSGPLGADPATWQTSRRPLARACLDWTERRSHLAGVAGAVVCRRFLERGWVARVGSGRAVRLTPTGRAVLPELLNLDPATVD